MVDFGAFAQLEPGVEGLIHISELADIAVAEPLKTVQIGDEVYVKILRVDSNRQRIGLSLRQAGDLGPVTSAQDEEEAEAEADEQEDVDQEAADQEIVSQGDVDQEAGEQEAVEDESEEE